MNIRNACEFALSDTKSFEMKTLADVVLYIETHFRRWIPERDIVRELTELRKEIEVYLREQGKEVSMVDIDIETLMKDFGPFYF